MTGGLTTISASTVDIASAPSTAAAAPRKIVRKTKLQDCRLLGIDFTSSTLGENEMNQTDGRAWVRWRRKFGGLVSCVSSLRSGWKEGREFPSRDTL